MKKLLKMLLVGTLCFGLCACSSDTSSEGESTDDTVVEEEEEKFVYDVVAPDWWNPTGIGTIIPAPDSEIVREGEISNDESDEFYAKITDFDEAFFDTYVSACKHLGFDVDANILSDDNYFLGYDEEGNSLEITYWTGLQEITIDLRETIANNDLNWPNSGLATLLPDTGCNKGQKLSDAKDIFSAYVVGFDQSAFNAYVDKCIDAGFDVDYSKSDTYLYASDSDGNELTIKYLGYYKTYISLYVPS